jgi:hypothetical protein
MTRTFHEVPSRDPWDQFTFQLREADDGTFYWFQRMLFGVRVQAGTTGGVDLDYCCGASKLMMMAIYAMVGKALSDGVALKDFPMQHEKPMHRDPECLITLARLATSQGATREVVEAMETLCVFAEKEHAERSDEMDLLKQAGATGA